MITTKECRFCGNTDFTYITNHGDKFSEEKVYFCDTCALVFLSPRISAVDDYYYSDSFSSEFRGEVEPSEETQQRLEEVAQFRWNTAQPHIKSGGTLLEIGCSSGEFLRKASESMDVYGLDPSTGFASSNKDLNIKIAAFPDFSFESEVDKFDVICAFHVLEHIQDPVEFLLAVRERLADDGVFYLEYPDLTYAMRRAFLDVTYFQKSHLYDFSLVSLIPILAKLGLGIDNIGKYKEFPRDKNVLAFIKKQPPETQNLYSEQTVTRVKNSLITKVNNVNFLRDTPLRVCHIASHGINVGDGAITSGIRKFLQEIPVNLEITNFDIVDFNRFTTGLIAEEINGLHPDLIIVGGGGTIDGHKTRVHTGTALQLPLEEFEQLQAPVGFWGLGHNIFPDQQVYNMDALENFVLLCKSKGFPFSVRRDLSKERLTEVLSEEAINYIQAVPDPGFFVPAEGVPYCLNPDPTRKNAILQIALDSTKHRFKNDDNLDGFIIDVMDLIMHLIDEHNTDVTLALHTLFDAQATNMVRAYFDDHETRNKARMYLRILGVSHPIYAQSFFANYANADIVIGMRGHSVICGTGLSVPTIALSTHDKVAGYMEEIGCSEWNFELGFDYAELISKVDGIMRIEDAVRQKGIVLEATEDWETQSRDFAHQCFNLV